MSERIEAKKIPAAKKSVLKRSGAITSTTLAFMAGMGLFEIARFYEFHERARKLFSGDYQGVVKIQLLDAKVRGLRELASLRAESAGAEDSFSQRSAELRKEVADLASAHGGKGFAELEKLSEKISALKLESAQGAPLAAFQKIKQSSFQLYRSAWANKWMTVAKILGQAITELDALTPESIGRVQRIIFPRVTQLVSEVTRAQMAQDQKLFVFEQLNALKNLVNLCQQEVEKSAKTRAERLEAVSKLESLMKKISEDQSRALLGFGEAYQPELVHAAVGGGFILIAALLWLWALGAHTKKLLRSDIQSIRSALGRWRDAGEYPSLGSRFFFSELEDILKGIQSAGSAMQRKSVAEKKLAENALTPQIVIGASGDQAKSAVFWNAALSGLAKQRRFSELGTVSYSKLLKFADGKGNPIDPVGKCIIDAQEISQVCLLRAGDESIPVLVQSVPVFSGDDVSWVVAEIRDLRAEQRRIESDLERQIAYVDEAAEALKASKVPREAQEGAKRSVTACVSKLRQYALRQQEKNDLLTGQVEALWNRAERETQLERRSLGELDEARARLARLASAIKEVCEHAKSVAWLQGAAAVSAEDIQKKLRSLRSQFDGLAGEMEKSREMLTNAAGALSRSHAVFGKVRTLQRFIEGVLGKSSVLNANNAILGSQNISSADVVVITENINDILQQFELGYQHLASVVHVLEKGFRESSGKIMQDLSLCARILGEDEQLILEVRGLEQAYERGHKELSGVFEAVGVLERSASRMGDALGAVKEKTDELAQLESSTFELHSQLEADLKSVFERVETDRMMS